jgi:hypothetical protein
LDSGKNHSYPEGVGTMRNKRFKFSDRRQDIDIPKALFKDSLGDAIKECRREIPDRRIDNIHTEWIEEIVIQ